MERWLGVSENLPIRECSRSIERHIAETLQASFANCGFNTEAELLLARAGSFLLLDIVSYDFPSLSSLCFPRKNFFLGILA